MVYWENVEGGGPNLFQSVRQGLLDYLTIKLKPKD